MLMLLFGSVITYAPATLSEGGIVFRLSVYLCVTVPVCPRSKLKQSEITVTWCEYLLQ